MDKSIKLLGILIFCSLAAYSQEASKTEAKSLVNEISVEEEGWNKRISFFVGAGVSVICNEVFELPIIDKTTNFVVVETSERLKPNVSLGIVYTPFVYDVERFINYYDVNGEKKVKKVIEHVPKHFSVALFINPISLASANSNLSTTVDLGVGAGWRSDNFSAFVTAEFFSLKQPRDYFIDKYGDNKKQYLIAEQVQTSIDVNDTSIFRNKVMTAIGFKLAYTFDIAKSYSTSANFSP